jgi:hypothetical protein
VVIAAVLARGERPCPINEEYGIGNLCIACLNLTWINKGPLLATCFQIHEKK